ncbi:uncharacterized protein LOC143913014 isoform X2 [Arctopsyche grandis]|uniref:uncharacterized protein LOC143913014 isoform X2 n=1 Tax=Arctopsyche grandis TaxID=121162 RepID=UPI00406D9C10
MECRLCLGSAPTVSIHDNPHPLAQLIRTCCRLPVKRGDGLPDALCLSCINTLELLSSFRNDCLQSNETSKLALKECLNVKTEEVLLEDVIWEDESDVVSSPNVCNDEVNDWKSNALNRNVSQQNIYLMENITSPIHVEKDISSDFVADDAEIPSQDSPLPNIYECSNSAIQCADILVLTETWLDDSVHDAELLDGTYSIFRKDRPTRGGGVLIAVKSYNTQE